MRQVTQFSTLFFYFLLHIGCFKLPNKPPDITLLSPTDVSYTFSNDTYVLKVSAQDPDGVERVEFLSDGKIIGTDRTAPYQFDYKNPSVGVHKITARAVDSKGLAAETASANLTVRGGLDVALEQIIQPTTTVTTTQIFPAIVLKNWGKTLVTSATISYILDNAAPVLVNWQGVLDANGGQTPVYLTPIRNENGYHNLSVKLEKINGRADDDPTNDAKSRTFLSSIVNTPPSVNMVAPAARSEVFQDENFIFEANATDRDGLIKRVDFFTDKVFLGSDSTVPYTLTRRDLPIGSYKVTARAYDDRDSATTSSETTLVVKPSYEVGITQIVAPTGILSTVYIAPTILVKNYGNKIITSCAIFYELDSSHIVHSLNWLGNIPIASQLQISLPQLRNENGLHNLRVWLDKPNGQADGNLLNNTSITHFTSSIFNTPPSVNLTAPIGNVTIRTNQAYTIKASAADLDGTVKKVEFFKGAVSLGIDSLAPYDFTVNNLPIGTYSITAVATDDRAATTFSTAATLTVIASALLSNDGDSSEIVAFSSKNTTFTSSSTPSVFSIKKEENAVFGLNEALVLSPNPAQAFVNLSVKDLPVGIYTVSLNQLGGYRQQQKSWVITERQEQLQLPLSATLSAGWYIVMVSNQQTCWSKKLYISR